MQVELKTFNNVYIVSVKEGGLENVSRLHLRPRQEIDKL